ncbi:hypothetical protein ACJJTC_016031, partial [Scirpophaga incertulas]
VSCPKCGTVCNSKRALTTHLLGHSGLQARPRPAGRKARQLAVCYLCGATFKSIQSNQKLCFYQIKANTIPFPNPHRDSNPELDSGGRQIPSPHHSKCECEHRVLRMPFSILIAGNNKLNRHLREVCEKNKLEEQLSAFYDQESMLV